MYIYSDSFIDILGLIIIIMILVSIFLIMFILLCTALLPCFNCILVPLRRMYKRKQLLKKLVIIQEQEDNCSICLEKLNTSETCKLKSCGHYYHTKCIIQWLTEEKNICPLCRIVP